MDFKNQEIKRVVIMDHYKNPENKPIVKKKNSIIKRKNNISCMDDIIISLEIDKGIVISGSFEGIACAVTTAATDILINLIKNKTIRTAIETMNKYKSMIKEKKTYEELSEAQVFQDAAKNPNRLNCVLMSSELILEILESVKNEIQ